MSAVLRTLVLQETCLYKIPQTVILSKLLNYVHRNVFGWGTPTLVCKTAINVGVGIRLGHKALQVRQVPTVQRPVEETQRRSAAGPCSTRCGIRAARPSDHMTLLWQAQARSGLGWDHATWYVSNCHSIFVHKNNCSLLGVFQGRMCGRHAGSIAQHRRVLAAAAQRQICWRWYDNHSPRKSKYVCRLCYNMCEF